MPAMGTTYDAPPLRTMFLYSPLPIGGQFRRTNIVEYRLSRVNFPHLCVESQSGGLATPDAMTRKRQVLRHKAIRNAARAHVRTSIGEETIAESTIVGSGVKKSDEYISVGA